MHGVETDMAGDKRQPNRGGAIKRHDPMKFVIISPYDPSSGKPNRG